MLFKSEYAPRDDAPEAAAEAEAVAVAEAPRASDARRALASHIQRREETDADMRSPREALGRLNQAIAGPGPIEREILDLDSVEANLIAAWSTAGGDFPKLDAGRRHALEESLSEARNKAQGAQRAIPTVEAGITRATIAQHQVTLEINATISEIILEESQPGLVEIAAMRLDIAKRMEVAAAARSLSLQLIETIPLPRRTEIGRGYYAAADQWEAARVAAVSTPAPSRERVTAWSRLVAELRSGDHLATVDHQAQAA
jgi:hypothetical protein